MLALLDKLWHLIVNDVNTVYRFVNRIIASVYTYIDQWLTILGREITSLWQSTESMFQTTWKFIVSTYNAFRYYLDIVIRDVETWVTRLWDDLMTYARDVYSFASQWIDWLRNRITTEINNLVAWIISHVWKPLDDAILLAWHWITHDGALLWDLVTHPDKLAKWLGAYLWKSWLTLITYYSKPIGHWLVRTMPGLAAEIATVMERIIASLL